MSLIHDSLRKLESNPSGDEGLDSKYKNYKANDGFNAKKMWMLIAVVLGVLLIIFAYFMLTKYQNQNQKLLDDMSQLNATGFSSELKAEPIKVKQEVITQEVVSKDKPLIVQPPIKILDESAPSYASLLKKVEEQDRALQKSKELQNTNANFLLRNTKPKIKTKPSLTVANRQKNNTSRISKVKKSKKSKLTIKQTRQLVNNLQIQIESKNTENVVELLTQLSQSSGENSLVYLRMKAYWATTSGDQDIAASMYKKILFQKSNDIQASTNLALLEAKNGNVKQAVNRLKVLRIEYPSDKNILAYLERIEGMYEE